MPLATKISPFNAPNYDVFSPARRSDARGVVLGAPLDGGNNYVPWIGLSTIRELALKHADKVGLVDEEEFRTVALEFDRTRVELRQAKERIAELEARQDRISGLAADGFKVTRIQGRPAKEAK